MAGLTLFQFAEQLQEICDRSDLVVSYDIRMLDNAVLKARVYLSIDAFVDVYFNPTNGACSYTLVQDNRRIYGADNAFVGLPCPPLRESRRTPFMRGSAFS